MVSEPRTKNGKAILKIEDGVFARYLPEYLHNKIKPQ